MGTKPKKCEKGKEPGTCSPKQIKECHGESGGHVCETGGKPARK